MYDSGAHGMGLIGSRVSTGLFELKLELAPNDVKLEGSKNYLVQMSTSAPTREEGGALFRGRLCWACWQT
jgi:hypothetical protein